MKSLRLVSLTAIGCLILLSSCQRGSRDIGEGDDGELFEGQVEVTETTSRGVDPGNRTLVIEGFNGRIQLSGTDGYTAQLEFTKRGRGRNDSAAQDALAGINVDEQGGDDAYRFNLTSDHQSRSSVDVRGTVPVATPIRIELANGSVSISAADGPIEVDIQNGTVQIGGTSRSVRVRASNGDIEVAVRMVQPDGTINLETSNGNVGFRMPGSSSARVDARTSVGSVIVEGLDFANRRLDRQAAGAAFSGALGGGNARVDIRVQNGVIRLSEGQTIDLPGISAPEQRPVPIQEDTSAAAPGHTPPADTTVTDSL
jgi:hypothetical protein